VSEIPTFIDALAARLKLDEREKSTLVAATATVALPIGFGVFDAGVPCRAYTFVRSGRIRVHQLDARGGEITLYRLGPGDTCVLNTASLLSGDGYAAYATTETVVDAVTLTASGFASLLASSDGFRQFVFRSCGERISSLMRVVREVAFERIDVRLARRILAIADGHARIDITHAELATELGTAREVVSRNLGKLERDGMLTLGRGRIEIHDPQSLAALERSGSTR